MSDSGPTQRSDDIARLKQHLGLAHMHYQDISLLAEQRRAIERWPLLAEIEARQTAAQSADGVDSPGEALTI